MVNKTSIKKSKKHQTSNITKLKWNKVTYLRDGSIDPTCGIKSSDWLLTNCEGREYCLAIALDCILECDEPGITKCRVCFKGGTADCPEAKIYIFPEAKALDIYDSKGNRIDGFCSTFKNQPTHYCKIEEK